MLLDKLLLQIPVATPDTVAANKIQEATNAVTAHVDSLTTKLHPDSIAAMTPGKLVDKFKYLDLGSLVTSLSSQLVSLALRILEGDFRDGDTVKVDSDGEKLSFSK